MKAPRFIIIASLLIVIYCKGQYITPYSRAQPTDCNFIYDEIVDTSKLWSVYLQYANIHYSMYYKIGDTITLGQNLYNMVYETNDSLYLTWNLSGYIRENENSEVYFRNTTGGEGLIYRFDIIANDSVVVYNPFVCPEYTTLIVLSTDSVWLGDSYRKRIFFYNSNNEDYWTEGIGSRFGLLFSNYCYVGVMYNLICYYEYDTLIYQHPDFESCYYPLIDNISNIEHSDLFQIRFNSIDRTLNINSSVGDLCSIPCILRIFNLLGSEMYSCRLLNYPQIIQANHFVKGFYLVNITSQGNLIYQSKIFIY
jgi:hypothetical protein